MPITDRVTRVPIDSIVVNRAERQRKQIVTKDLEASISNIGLINPIVIDAEHNLKAGERRLEACRKLGHKDILARFVEDLSPIEAQIIELEENLKRSELEWQDQVDAVARIHGLYLALDPDWTMTETAEAISLTQGTVSMYVRVSSELKLGAKVEGTPQTAVAARIADSGSIREAYNIISRRESRAMGDAVEELLGLATGAKEPENIPSEPRLEHILNESFLTWAPRYSGPKFNLIHCDFPYGVEFAAGPYGLGAEPGEAYADSDELYWALIECLCKNIESLVSPSAHLMFWCSAELRRVNKTLETFLKLAPSIEFHKFPLIWVKSDNKGIAGDPSRHPRHIYEICLLGTRGRRQVAKIVSDAYSCPTDKRLHISTKPEPMLRHFMTMLVDESTSLLDPTCGSGAALRAADSLGARSILGLEIDSECCERARQALRVERLKRLAHETLVKEPEKETQHS